MKNFAQKLLVLVMVVGLISLALPHNAQAAAPAKVVIGDTYTLEDGERLDEDLVILGGMVSLEEGSVVNGDVTVIGGTLEVAGTIMGDITATGGYAHLAETAVVTGDISTAGAALNRDEGATIEGEVRSEYTNPFITIPGGVPVPSIETHTHPVLALLYFFARVVLWSLLAMLLAMFVAEPLHRTSEAALTEPLIAGGLGLLTVVVMPLVLVAVGLTILLLPVSLVGFLLLALAWAFGLIAFGTELGRRFFAIFHKDWHPALAAGAGTFLLILALNGLDAAIPCLGWMPKALVGLLGLGGVMLTRFGAETYNPRTGLRAYAVNPAVPAAPPDEPPAAE
ncbi:MAG TPA: polymer-forming cytoskeletal protein [Anaerolineales bacterium]|nr:polymer-forming cytoskeletal protein [Anaerolineales bacterium]